MAKWDFLAHGQQVVLAFKKSHHRRALWKIKRAFRARHTVRTLIEEVISAVAVAEIVKLPRLRGTDSVSYLFLIDEHFDRTKIPSKVTCVRIRLHQLRWCDLCVPLCGGRHPVPEPLLQLEQTHRLLRIEQLRSDRRPCSVTRNSHAQIFLRYTGIAAPPSDLPP